MKFVTLAPICKFDDMYAASLFENKMKAAAGKKLIKYYFRRHSYLEKKLNDDDDEFHAVNTSREVHQECYGLGIIDYS